MLETYPQENMNTQAIRELTNEVFNLKSRLLETEKALSEAEDAIDVLNSEQKIKITTYKHELTDQVELNAGASTTITNVTLPAVTGFTPIGFYVSRIANALNDTLTKTVVTRNDITNNSTAICLLNSGAGSVSVKYIDMLIFYVAE